MELPKFKYHPDPLKTGCIKESDETCQVCEQKTGYIYNGTIYGGGKNNIERICPWCIANGEAHEKFQVSFATPPIYSDDMELMDESFRVSCSKEAHQELVHRTPGFPVFNEVDWLECCNDFCEYHGIATVGDFKKISDKEKERFKKTAWHPEEAIELLQKGRDEEEHCYYLKFVCIKCGEIMFSIDPS